MKTCQLIRIFFCVMLSYNTSIKLYVKHRLIHIIPTIFCHFIYCEIIMKEKILIWKY
jgi:hypothetical protein